MSRQGSKHNARPSRYTDSEESTWIENDFSVEMPSWAALPGKDGDWNAQKEEKVEDQKEIPGFPSSVTLTWAYFPEFFS